MTPDELFEAAVAPLLGEPRITRSKMFGSPGLQISGKVFAVLVKGKLVVKLPRERVEALAASGHGEHFDPGMGRPMKEWAAVEPLGEAEWKGLVVEALAFVASGLPAR